MECEWGSILKDTKKRYWLSVVYRSLIVLTIIIGGISILSVFAVLSGVQERADFPLVHYIILLFWLPTLIIVSLLVIIWAYFKKLGGKNDVLDPYIVRTTPRSFESLIEELSITTQLDSVKSGYCSYYERWGLDDFGKIMCLISNQDEYGDFSFSSLTDRLFDEARDLYGIKMISISMARKTVVLYIYTFNLLNEGLIARSNRNAKHPLGNYLPVYESYIDLSTGIIYIPVEMSTEYGITGAYRAIIEYLCDKLS